ncbi:MAG: hypothetical protein KAH20_15465 [Methylococcales bacterium]|nr:hypothetical protein [Methylococcales bacterium]
MKLLRIFGMFFCFSGLFTSQLISNVSAEEILILPNNQWQQISLPGIPPTNANTIKTIFGDDISGIYGTDWIMFAYDPETNRYIDPGLNGVLKHGIGYWIYQLGGSNATLDLPTNMSPASGSVTISPQCASPLGCFEIDLAAQLNTRQWLMLGNPFTRSITWTDLRLTTKNGPCADTNGCTLNEAKNLGIFHNQGWRYNPVTSKYDLIDGGNLNVWNGFWGTVLENANGLDPKLLIPLNSDDTPTAKLLFSSGFENGVYIDPNPVLNREDYAFIRGTDNKTGFSWPIDILGSSESALHHIDDNNFQALEAEIQTVLGHNGTPTKALYNIEHYAVPNGATQYPYEILNITEGKKDLYIRYWMKIDAESLTQKNKWRALFEYKTKDYAAGTGFRLISYIYTNNQGQAFWHWQGDANPLQPVWEIDNYDIPVPANEWFLTEYYWHWSEGGDGRALWKINGQVVGDHYGPTTRNSKPIDFIMLTQIYGNGNPKHQWIDDIEIWDGLPE